MDLSAEEQAWLDQMTPADALPVGYIAVFSYILPDGGHGWKAIWDVDAPVSESIGMLELAKLEMIARTNTGLPIRYEEQ